MIRASPRRLEDVARMLPSTRSTVWSALILICAAAAISAKPARHSPYIAAQHSGSAAVSYGLQWGIDSMQAHQTNAGNLIRFSYRVVDTNKAKVLIDKAA